ncbi:MlaA family lipoprotein [Sneathiella glossodoripedis]|uniref:MlaA family lipoprotein n=1 Tax=Sneathiella glossodoripedis TaxID=418853 RepID=UPI0011DCD508|nr:VacJ family lipoprotein [Sneathiella glossodoripedis]
MISLKFKSKLLNGCFAIALAGLLGACATPPGENTAGGMNAEVNDPLEPMNRYFHDVNFALDELALKPVSHIYRDALPEGVKNSVSNFLTNLSQPIYFLNNVAQGDLDGAGDNMGAFFTNTVLGFGGLFDVAQLDTDEEDLGQTFAVWGIGEGPYLVLPVLGPNTTREAVGMVGEHFIDPANLVVRNNDMENFPLVRAGVTAVDFRSRSLDALDEIEKNSIDFYAAIRSLYRQNRKNLILDGEAENAPLPDISFEQENDKPTLKQVSLLFESDETTEKNSAAAKN